ncbi:MAG: His/Gly/Thr/Pro-type tRNA ligase C-terminal domain-containing protein, partial [Gammaproteobacteria bacterium]
SLGLRTKADLRNEKINYKVREHSVAKVPTIIAVGKREIDERTVSVRRLGEKEQHIMPLDEALVMLSTEAKLQVSSKMSFPELVED